MDDPVRHCRRAAPGLTRADYIEVNTMYSSGGSQFGSVLNRGFTCLEHGSGNAPVCDTDRPGIGSKTGYKEFRDHVAG
jgi:hypothetical protein